MYEILKDESEETKNNIIINLLMDCIKDQNRYSKRLYTIIIGLLIANIITISLSLVLVNFNIF